MLTQHCHDSFQRQLGFELLHAKAEYIKLNVDLRVILNFNIKQTLWLNQNLTFYPHLLLFQGLVHLYPCLWWVYVDNSLILFGGLVLDGVCQSTGRSLLSANQFGSALEWDLNAMVTALSQAGWEKHGSMDCFWWATHDELLVRTTVKRQQVRVSRTSSRFTWVVVSTHWQAWGSRFCKQRCLSIDFSGPARAYLLDGLIFWQVVVTTLR